MYDKNPYKEWIAHWYAVYNLFAGGKNVTIYTSSTRKPINVMNEKVITLILLSTLRQDLDKTILKKQYINKINKK